MYSGYKCGPNLRYRSRNFSGTRKKFVFLVSRDGCVALPRGAMGLSAVCDCGIS